MMSLYENCTYLNRMLSPKYPMVPRFRQIVTANFAIVSDIHTYIHTIFARLTRLDILITIHIYNKFSYELTNLANNIEKNRV